MLNRKVITFIDILQKEDCTAGCQIQKLLRRKVELKCFGLSQIPCNLGIWFKFEILYRPIKLEREKQPNRVYCVFPCNIKLQN